MTALECLPRSSIPFDGREQGSRVPARACKMEELAQKIGWLKHNPTMGKARDLDASIDRINDPPPQLWPTLFAIRAHCETHSINLHSLFWGPPRSKVEGAGGPTH